MDQSEHSQHGERRAPSRSALTLAMLSALVILVLAGATPAATATDAPHAGGSAAAAADVEVKAPCEEIRERQPGVHVKQPSSTDVTGGYAAFPPRLETDVQPGRSYQLCVGFQNRTGRTINAEFMMTNVTDSGNPKAPVKLTSRETDFGAADWVKVPAPTLRVEHGDIVWMDIRVAVPSDALAGSNYAALVMRERQPKLTGAGATARVAGAVSTEIFFDVPGDVGRSGKLSRAEAPGVIWWDGLNFARIHALERLRGIGFAPFQFEYRNTGDLSEELEGRIVIRSFTGKVVKRIDVASGLIFRGGSRSFEGDWTDPPLVGRFTPTVELTGRNGKLVKQELDPIWVIPAWWYILLVILAIAIPTWLTIRRRRRMNQLLARLDAAERRSLGHDEDDDDLQWDEAGR